MKEIERALPADLIKWRNCVPILGLTPPKTAWKLGEVTLIDITDPEGKEILAQADRITDGTLSSDETKEHAKSSRKKDLIDDHPNQAFALVTTSGFLMRRQHGPPRNDGYGTNLIV